MKAIVHDEFGSPDVLKLTDVDPPTPKGERSSRRSTPPR